MSIRLSFMAIFWCALCCSAAHADDEVDCRVGTYRLKDSSLVDIAQSEGGTLRWRRMNGTTGQLEKAGDGLWRSTFGWTGRPDGKDVLFPACGKILFDGVKGRQIVFDTADTAFVSHGTELAGRLVMPKGKGRAPVVVLVHGAERTSALTYYYLQRLLPSAGVGAFVYDKRGTGASGGEYTQDFELLADDAVAAMKEARRLAGGHAERVGFQGGSQAGWILPIAANKSSVDFAIISFGLAVSVLEEDRQQVEKEMRDKGYSDEVIAKALEIVKAVGEVVASGFETGFEELDAVRSKYEDEPWYKDVHGNFTHFFLPYDETELRAMAPEFDWNTPFRYDPMPALRANSTPQLWILGGEDYEAPSGETSLRIKSLIDDGLPFILALYPDAEHGMTLFEMGSDGNRVSTRYVEGYFQMIVDFAKTGKIKSRYGDAEITR